MSGELDDGLFGCGLLIRLGVALLALAFLIGVLGYFNQRGWFYLPETLRQIVVAFDNNATTELASIAITILVVDRLYERRETEREKKRLILQMGSPDNAFAVEAVRALRAHGWLYDGALKGAFLMFANLQGDYLVFANLQGAYLRHANLQEANLEWAQYNNVTTWPKGFTPPPEAVNVDAERAKNDL